MTSRTSTFLAGIAVIIGAAALIFVAPAYDLGASLIVGLAAGAAVALAPAEKGARKIAGFLVGVVAAAAGYVLRAGLLPDSATGSMIGVSAVFLLITLVAVITRGRTPLWASFAGVAAMAGAYETVHLLDFAGLLVNLPIAVAGTLLASAVGFTAASLFTPSAKGSAPAADIDLTHGELKTRTDADRDTAFRQHELV